MRILIDESVPEQLGTLLLGHAWSSVRREGWAGLKNGVLLASAATRFDALLTPRARYQRGFGQGGLKTGLVEPSWPISTAC